MASARSTRSTTTAAPTASTSRARATAGRKPVDDTIELAKTFGKVLKVSEPPPQDGAAYPPSSRRTAASNISKPLAGATGATRKPMPVAPRSAARPGGTAPSTTARPKGPVTTATGASRKQDLESNLPWAADDMLWSERAKGAKAAINGAMKSLSAATQAGYSVQPNPPSIGKGKERAQQPAQGEWTTQKVDELLQTCEIALRVLRELDAEGKLGGKGIEVEKAATSLVGKCVAMGMYTRALTHLARAKPALLRKYRHPPFLPTPPPETAATRPHRVGAVKVAPPGGTSRPGKQADVDGQYRRYTELLRMPLADSDANIDETVRLLLCQNLLHTWTALLASDILLDSVEISSNLRLPGNSTMEDDTLHPLHLASTLPGANITPSIQSLYRHLSGVKLSLCTLVLTITTKDNPSRTTPSQLWVHAQKTYATYVESNKGIAEAMCHCAKVLGDFMSWSECVVRARGEDRSSWCTGREWNEFMNFWIGLARRVGDSVAIERALSLMTCSTHVSTPPPPSTPPNGHSVASLPSAPNKARTPAKEQTRTPSAGSEGEIFRLNGELAKVTILLDKHSASPTALSAAAAESALKSCDLPNLSDALLGLESGQQGKASLSKTVRAVERIRRNCTVSLSSKSEVSLVAAAQHWLNSAVDLAEDILQSPLDISEVASDVVAGAVDSLLSLTKSADPSSLLAHLENGHRLVMLAGASTAASDQADWLRCLAAAAYNTATQLWKESNLGECLKVGRKSVEWAEDGLNLIDGHDACQPSRESLIKYLPRRYELIGVVLYKTGDSKGALEAYFNAIGRLSKDIVDKLAQDAESRSPKTVFALSPELSPQISKITQLVAYDRSVMEGRVEALVNCITLPPAVKGIILERMVEDLLEGMYQAEMAEIVIAIGDSVRELYTLDEMPIRRARLNLLLMAAICQTGVANDRFNGLARENECLSSLTDLSHDGGHAASMQEILATTHLLQTLHVYPASSDPCASVLDKARLLITELRGMLLPASTTAGSGIITLKAKSNDAAGRRVVSKPPTRVTKTAKPVRIVSEPKQGTSTRRVAKAETSAPKRRLSVRPAVLDDLPRLAKLLSTVIALLGIQGHILVKVEAMKLLRAWIRNEEDLVDEYVSISTQLAIEYLKLGKQSRARFLFAQTAKHIENSKRPVSLHARVEYHLRHAVFLAMTGSVAAGQGEYQAAHMLAGDIPTPTGGGYVAKVTERFELLDRAVLARNAAAAIALAKGDATTAIVQLGAATRLAGRAGEVVCRLAPRTPSQAADLHVDVDDSDPFKLPVKDENKIGANEPSKDATTKDTSWNSSWSGKHLGGAQWYIAESMISIILVYTTLQADRGSVREVTYLLNIANEIAKNTKSVVMSARISTRSAEISSRLRKYEESIKTLSDVASRIEADGGGLDRVEVNRVKGDVFAKQEMVEEAAVLFESATKDVHGLEAIFVAAEALMPSPRKTLRASTSTNAIARPSLNGTEILLPQALAHVLRQQAWLMQEAGFPEDCEQLLQQIQALTTSTESHVEDLYLDGRIGLHEAFSHFKTDLWMSSLTESTIAMPMGNLEQRSRDRQSTRMSIQMVLQKSEKAFMGALDMAPSRGKVEDVRQACLSLALLRAFQTSLGEGSTEVTRAAAALLASSPAITLHRELVEAIDFKFTETPSDETKWPSVTNAPSPATSSGDVTRNASPVSRKPARRTASTPTLVGESVKSDDLNGNSTRTFWESMRAKYAANPVPIDHDLSLLPADWTVVSINMTEDRSTMFISRHRAGTEPLVFSLPIERQGRREGDAEEDILTFTAAVDQLHGILGQSDEGARNAKNVSAAEDRKAWWAKRYELDKRLQELVQQMEFCWLGAFKTILSPPSDLSAKTLETFRNRLERIFTLAISAGSVESKKLNKVHLDPMLVECFANLGADCKEEEAEDLVWFILDIYQFHGVDVAPSELDIDQIGVDIKTALTELEAARAVSPISANEHTFLALDKNVSGFPWESIPILRGRAVSRVPSLPILLDQINMGHHLSLPCTPDGRRLVDVKRVYYILNPSGDLARTQTYFEPWLEGMKERAGWRGIVGRSPTELEMVEALTTYELVLYFGHGGAEQYIRSYKIKHLQHCASVMLWGCSSGLLKEQGDFDRTGTAWNYMMAGCPSLVANLWDVTDRDIDRLSDQVLKTLNINAGHVPDRLLGSSSNLLPISEWSNVQAVAKSRDECKLKYLTGAAPVVYGLPIYMH